MQDFVILSSQKQDKEGFSKKQVGQAIKMEESLESFCNVLMLP